MFSLAKIILCCFFLLCAKTSYADNSPLIIGHRGACGYLPEHTLASYQLAIDMGVDFIEPDIVCTKDGVLICSHDNDLSHISDIAEKFPDRKTSKTIYEKKIEGWFVQDFTLAEIKTLRAKERHKARHQGYNGIYQLVTLQELIDLALKESVLKKRTIGLVPEMKCAYYHQTIGLPLEEKLVEILHKNGYRDESAPVIIQSFEVTDLQKLKKMTKIRLAQLVGAPDQQPACLASMGKKTTFGDMISAQGLLEISQYARAICASKELLIPRDKNNKIIGINPLWQEAKKAGLLVYVYTLRNEPIFLAADYHNDPLEEYYHFFKLGIDAVFTDYPFTAVYARNEFNK